MQAYSEPCDTPLPFLMNAPAASAGGDTLSYEYMVPTTHHGDSIPSNRTLILVGIACVVLAYLYKMNTAATKVPTNAARSVSAMVTRVLSGRPAPAGKAARASVTVGAGEKEDAKTVPSNVRIVDQEAAKKLVHTCDKSVLMVVWATWCGHCHEAMGPLSKAAAKLLKEKGIETVAVNGARCSNETLEALGVRAYPSFIMIWAPGRTSMLQNHPANVEEFTNECSQDPAQTFAMYY